MTKKVGIIIFLFFVGSIISCDTLRSQNILERYWNTLVKDTADVSKPQLLVYPTVGFAPETSWEIGFSSLYVYFANQDTTNRLSELNAFTFYTLEDQYGLWFDHALYSDQDKWFVLGRLRFQSFPLFYHGIGPDSPSEYTAKVEAIQTIVKERILRKLKKDIFIGLEFDYQRLANTNFALPDPNTTDFQFPLGADGSSNFGIGLGIVQDNRHNVLNVRKGLFSELAFLTYNKALGSTYNFTTVYSDTRIYQPIGKNNVVAAQLLGQFNSGDVPFNQMALLGGESIMRGYYYGRYRDKNQIATQLEFRFLPLPLEFSNRIGLTVFASAGTVFDEFKNLNVNNVVTSAGVGLRFLLFPKKDIWSRIDFAVTGEGTGFYVFIGEAF